MGGQAASKGSLPAASPAPEATPGPGPPPLAAVAPVPLHRPGLSAAQQAPAAGV